MLFLDLPAAAAEARGEYGAERYERADMQARVRQLYEDAFFDAAAGWVRVDASGSEDEVAKVIADIVDEKLAARERGVKRAR